ncbi:uncharacterized protein [Ptychodera flava]|uniref:uncharacterized protein n=1 Tax=Ptychodera flava TaxID=63121 RepID=UPI003969F91F
MNDKSEERREDAGNNDQGKPLDLSLRRQTANDSSRDNSSQSENTDSRSVINRPNRTEGLERGKSPGTSERGGLAIGGSETKNTCYNDDTRSPSSRSPYHSTEHSNVSSENSTAKVDVGPSQNTKMPASPRVTSRPCPPVPGSKSPTTHPRTCQRCNGVDRPGYNIVVEPRQHVGDRRHSSHSSASGIAPRVLYHRGRHDGIGDAPSLTGLLTRDIHQERYGTCSVYDKVYGTYHPDFKTYQHLARSPTILDKDPAMNVSSVTLHRKMHDQILRRLNLVSNGDNGLKNPSMSADVNGGGKDSPTVAHLQRNMQTSLNKTQSKSNISEKDARMLLAILEREQGTARLLESFEREYMAKYGNLPATSDEIFRRSISRVTPYHFGPFLNETNGSSSIAMGMVRSKIQSPFVPNQSSCWCQSRPQPTYVDQRLQCSGSCCPNYHYDASYRPKAVAVTQTNPRDESVHRKNHSHCAKDIHVPDFTNDRARKTRELITIDKSPSTLGPVPRPAAVATVPSFQDTDKSSSILEKLDQMSKSKLAELQQKWVYEMNHDDGKASSFRQRRDEEYEHHKTIAIKPTKSSAETLTPLSLHVRRDTNDMREPREPQQETSQHRKRPNSDDIGQDEQGRYPSKRRVQSDSQSLDQLGKHPVDIFTHIRHFGNRPNIHIFNASIRNQNPVIAELLFSGENDSPPTASTATEEAASTQDMQYDSNRVQEEKQKCHESIATCTCRKLITEDKQ